MYLLMHLQKEKEREEKIQNAVVLCQNNYELGWYGIPRFCSLIFCHTLSLGYYLQIQSVRVS